MHKVLVTGSRNWPFENEVWSGLDFEYDLARQTGQPMVLIHGDCPTGADSFAVNWFNYMRNLGYGSLTMDSHPADWSLGSYAGPKRNKEMIALKPNVVLAFPLGLSKGTRGTIQMAIDAGIAVKDFS